MRTCITHVALFAAWLGNAFFELALIASCRLRGSLWVMVILAAIMLVSMWRAHMQLTKAIAAAREIDRRLDMAEKREI